MMNVVAKYMPTILTRSSAVLNSVSHELQQQRGIRVQVRDLNLERALSLMQKKMQSSGIERLIKSEQSHHIKNSEKRVLARKARERTVQSQQFSRVLKSLLDKKVRGL
ncbi:uncharacterized protein LOC113763491 [Coffea eugenioides]|uniref:uncharacterized protein LOC113763491 n=1 Tax=Coffea eugenioides TaxID=49369 RepID=UPI000F60EFCE|nr:uncharacterized protein LOC113763491 [Coffea eugenioides]XP_027163131.1 uncharacterized protein LOC113763491 [Coffea eugenioides]